MKKIAFALIKQYVTGWQQNNIQQICECLAENCTVIESHGPIYQGIQDIKQWFHLWQQANSKISKWDILSFYYYKKGNTAFFEWEFACISNNVSYAFAGISKVKFMNKKITFIHEYRMTKPAYIWNKNKLQSE